MGRSKTLSSNSKERARIKVEDKRLINCAAVDVNQLMPIKYPWALEHYFCGCANHWSPREISMAKDIELWNSGELTAQERVVIKRYLGFFSTAESLIGNNIAMAIFQYLTNAEVRQYLLRQMFEEALHTESFLYIVESLGLEPGEIFNMYRENDLIAEKDALQIELTEALINKDFTTETLEGQQILLKNLIRYYLITEGLFFYVEFAMIFALRNNNKMPGIGEITEYIARDESIHLNFGIDVINTLIAENPEVWTEEMQKWVLDAMDESQDLEIRFALDTLGDGIVGMRPDMCDDYVKFIADRRLERIGLPAQYYRQNPFPWMSEVIDIRKEKNFFETRVTEYQSASRLTWS